MTHHEFTIPTLSRIPTNTFSQDDLQEDTQRVVLSFWLCPPDMEIYAEVFDPVSEVFFSPSTDKELRDILTAVGIHLPFGGTGKNGFGYYFHAPITIKQRSEEPIRSFLNSPKFQDEMRGDNCND